MSKVVRVADLRAATEDDVVKALDGAYCQPQCSPAELLELFNRMLDVLVGEDARTPEDVASRVGDLGED